MTEFPVVLVINCGSSSIKFSVLDAASCDCLLNGVAEGINAERAFLSLNGGEPVALAQRGYEGALQAIAGALAQRDLIDSVALIGHRVAHGGDLFTESVIISEEVINNIRQVSSTAPLHNYASLSGIASAQRLFPEVMQVAVFDTSFHQTPPRKLFSMVCRGSITRISGYAATVSTAPRTAMCPSAPWRCSGCRSRRAAW